MRRFFLVLLILFVTAPVPAAFAREESRVLQEIERGIYIQGMVGPKIFLSPPAREGQDKPVVMGTSMGIAVGYDILDVFQLEGFVSGAQIRAPSTYGGLGDAGDPHGDFSSFVAGVKGRFAVLSLPDVQGVRRLHVSANAGGGFMTTSPESVIAEGRPTLLAGGGLHYFTRMRHFLVGFEVDALYGLGADALIIYPQLRLSYTF